MTKYPHMSPMEEEIWDRFLKVHGDYFTRFEYDIHIGESPPPPPGLAEPYLSAMKVLSLLRIDVVGYRKNEVWIFEVKPTAGLSTIGQLIAYKDWWLRQREKPEVLYLAAVTDMLSPNVEYSLKEQGIKYYVV